ncbi:MAG: hypothetical protein AB1659_13825, partial [Thermodesulfobacteriota bacterium]
PSGLLSLLPGALASSASQLMTLPRLSPPISPLAGVHSYLDFGQPFMRKSVIWKSGTGRGRPMHFPLELPVPHAFTAA